MLPLKLQQIKERIEERKQSSVLNRDEFDLLEELNFLNENEIIQTEIQYQRRINKSHRQKGRLLEMIAPAPDKCPACGRRF